MSCYQREDARKLFFALKSMHLRIGKTTVKISEEIIPLKINNVFSRTFQRKEPIDPLLIF